MKHAKKLYLTAVLSLALAFTGCSNQNDKKAEAPAEQKEAAVQAPAQDVKALPPAQVAEAATLEGTVVETFNSGGYTYIHLDTGSKKLWAAVGETSVAAGEKVTLQNGPVMTDFYSKTLDRTFPEIIFSGGCQVAGKEPQAAAAPAGGEAAPSFSAALQGEGAAPVMPPPGMGVEDAGGGSIKAVTPVQEVKVDKAEGENGYKVEEIFEKAADLAGKKVKIRGKVVKVSPNIMGRNWVHLQDGSGDAMKNSHDLVVTTADVPELNSIVVAEGVLTKDKDFGSGYFYNVIIEEALITK